MDLEENSYFIWVGVRDERWLSVFEKWRVRKYYEVNTMKELLEITHEEIESALGIKETMWQPGVRKK